MLSVIVAIYNVEKYLFRCIESIVNQRYRQLEILLIDDGSTDASSLICDEFARKDGRIKVLHKKNEGLVKARKTGLDMAAGRYITFVDGDDWINVDMYFKMIEAIQKSEADFVNSGYICEKEEKKEIIRDMKERLLHLNPIIRHRLFLSLMGLENFVVMNPSICCKVFKSELIRKAYGNVPEYMQYGEDVINLLYCILSGEKMFQLNEAFYHYNYRENSLSHSRSASHIRKESELWNYCGRIMLQWDPLMYQKYVDTFLYQKLLSAYNFVAGYEINAVQYYSYPCIERLFDKRIILYGAGRVGRNYLTQLSKCGRCEVVCWTDKNFEKYDYGYREVISVDKSLKSTYDVILIAVARKDVSEEIMDSLVNKEVLPEKIVWCEPMVLNEGA